MSRELRHETVIPLVAEEFVVASRRHPIIFSAGDYPAPMALMGLLPNKNVWVSDDDQLSGSPCIPAYVRRYPFFLAPSESPVDLKLLDRARRQASRGLLIDPSAMDPLGEEGAALFDQDGPSETTKAALNFCNALDDGAVQTQDFVDELLDAGLLMDGEIVLQRPDNEPLVYRGFQMVDEAALRDLDGPTLERLNKNGVLPLIYAQLFSMHLTQELFSMHLQRGQL